jgi:hypothetical protein
MPSSRRRRRRQAGQRGWASAFLIAVAIAFAVVVVVGSFAEIHRQSSAYRTSTNTGYAELASRVVQASNRTGAQLVALVDGAPQLTNVSIPHTAIPYAARARLQQGLDQAVKETAAQADRAGHLAPPQPFGDLAGQFSQVLADRATAVSGLQYSIDQLLGMTPLPIAGAPPTSVASGAAPLISIGQATTAMSAEGTLLQQADDHYRALVATIGRQRLAIHLPASAWVPSPVDTASLGAVRLGGLAPALSATPAFVPLHRLVVTAVGLSPPAIPSCSTCIGIVGTWCNNPQSTVPGATPTILPPTASVGAGVTVTNCGTVVESGVVVTESLVLADLPGTAAPPDGSRGGSVHATVSLLSGSSTALTMAPLPVAGGHRYTLTIAIATPPSQVLVEGSTQQFLLQISG